MSTENTTTPDHDEPEAVEAPEHEQADEAQQPEPEDTGESSNSEAARYRRRLRETEAERDALRTRVESYQRADVERRISDALETPADVWLTGVQLSDVCDENGEIDEHELDQVVLAVTTEHPAWRKRERLGIDPDQGKKSEHYRSPSWTGLLRAGGQE